MIFHWFSGFCLLSFCLLFPAAPHAQQPGFSLVPTDSIRLKTGENGQENALWSASVFIRDSTLNVHDPHKGRIWRFDPQGKNSELTWQARKAGKRLTGLRMLWMMGIHRKNKNWERMATPRHVFPIEDGFVIQNNLFFIFDADSSFRRATMPGFRYKKKGRKLYETWAYDGRTALPVPDENALLFLYQSRRSDDQYLTQDSIVEMALVRYEVRRKGKRGARLREGIGFVLRDTLRTVTDNFERSVVSWRVAWGPKKHLFICHSAGKKIWELDEKGRLISEMEAEWKNDADLPLPVGIGAISRKEISRSREAGEHFAAVLYQALLEQNRNLELFYDPGRRLLYRTYWEGVRDSSAGEADRYRPDVIEPRLAKASMHLQVFDMAAGGAYLGERPLPKGSRLIGLLKDELVFVEEFDGKKAEVPVYKFRVTTF